MYKIIGFSGANPYISELWKVLLVQFWWKFQVW